ncbi:MAG: squalene/phytoene synthase family protein, partial [Alphaproteobacteria bacterium]
MIPPAEDTGEDTARATARRTGSSFYAAMRLMPASRRGAIYAIYDFCRAVDDIADGPLTAAAKRERLDRWRADIQRVCDGQGEHPIARALAVAVRAHGLDKADLLAVIDGVAMDAEGTMRAPSRARLDRYIDGVACAVGRLAVKVFGCPEAEGLALAAVLGRALQLTNILRDLDEDARAGRLYLPGELLEAHGIAPDDPAAVLRHPALPAACG